MLETPPIAVLAMLAAGVANAVALTTISKALQYITVAKANATQIALSALAASRPAPVRRAGDVAGPRGTRLDHRRPPVDREAAGSPEPGTHQMKTGL